MGSSARSPKAAPPPAPAEVSVFGGRDDTLALPAAAPPPEPPVPAPGPPVGESAAPDLHPELGEEERTVVLPRREVGAGTAGAASSPAPSPPARTRPAPSYEGYTIAAASAGVATGGPAAGQRQGHPVQVLGTVILLAAVFLVGMSLTDLFLIQNTGQFVLAGAAAVVAFVLFAAVSLAGKRS